MVQKGFQDTATHLDSFRRETHDRFDRIEKLLLADHKRRIERLEGDVRDLKDLLAIK